MTPPPPRGGARQGSGRKALPKEEKRAVPPYRVDPETIKRLRALSQHYRISGGKILDHLVATHRQRPTLDPQKPRKP